MSIDNRSFTFRKTQFWIIIVSVLVVTALLASTIKYIYTSFRREGGAQSINLPRREFSGINALKHIEAQMAFGPRPAGSAASKATAEYITNYLLHIGWSVESQEFEHRGVNLRNIIGRSTLGNAPIIIGAHYDTRPVADQDAQNPNAAVPGANDGASGVAVLLELARCLDLPQLSEPIWLVFFDAEDRGQIDQWDWSVGARYMANRLDVRPTAVIVVDMIGDANQQIYMEGNSDLELSRQIWEVARRLGYSSFINEIKWSMIDDHLPFRDQGIPALLLIDFDYPYWHTTEDTLDKVSAASLERVGRVLEVWLEDREYE